MYKKKLEWVEYNYNLHDPFYTILYSTFREKEGGGEGDDIQINQN